MSRLLFVRLLAAGTLPLFVAACVHQAPAPVPPAPVYAGPVLAVDQVERGVQIVLPSTVLFETGKSSFNVAEAGPYLNRVADLLIRKTQKQVAVEGHTDADGSEALNQALSQARAKAVEEALVQRGVPQARLMAQGFSFNRPVASNATDDGKRLNRRVELIVLEEQVAHLTEGEPAGAFESAWSRLKGLIDQGLVKPVDAR
jgi:outer membrane protein OmpA-like peptidoglycan-associated protein